MKSETFWSLTSFRSFHSHSRCFIRFLSEYSEIWVVCPCFFLGTFHFPAVKARGRIVTGRKRITLSLLSTCDASFLDSPLPAMSTCTTFFAAGTVSSTVSFWTHSASPYFRYPFWTLSFSFFHLCQLQKWVHTITRELRLFIITCSLIFRLCPSSLTSIKCWSTKLHTELEVVASLVFISIWAKNK